MVVVWGDGRNAEPARRFGALAGAEEALALRVAIVTSEAVPFAKSGGLADMVGSLAVALTRRGLDVALVLPAYRCIVERMDVAATGMAFQVPAADGLERTEILEGVAGKDTPVYFVRADRFFDRPGLYGQDGGDYEDNADRFACFARAALALLARLGPYDVLHGHDWQTGLAVAYLRLQPERYPSLASARTVFTVHNVGYQGLFDAGVFPRLQVDAAHYWPNFEFYGDVCFLKAGLSLADRLTTVSPTYAGEVMTAEQGCGLDGLFRARAGDLVGIMNGADYAVWDPATDSFIARRYSAADPAGKHDCKRDLQQRLGLPPTDAPLAGMVARLVDQKGLDILAGALDALLSRDLQIAVLGTGDPHQEQALSGFARRHPDRMAVRIGFDEALAHAVEAGSDLFLMPSRYEPSGLNQLYSLRYGTIPVVRATGGLKDSVSPFDEAAGEGTGFLFEDYASDALVQAVDRALDCYARPVAWRRLMANAMAQDFSVDRTAAEYAALYASFLDRAD